MRTKEEILQESAGLSGLAFHAKFQDRNCLSINEAKSAMDSYAKEIAIAFNQFVSDNFMRTDEGFYINKITANNDKLQITNVFNQFINQVK